MARRRFAALLLVVTAGLAGCLPIPHTVRVTGRVSGTVTRNEKPVAGARVMVAADPSCIAPVREAVTKEDGAFDLAPFHKWVPIIDLAYGGESNLPESVCVETPEEGRRAGYSRGGSTTPEDIVLRCELTVPPKGKSGCIVVSGQ
ncbi:MAG TPA: hypothetical protein VMR86_16135 [Myxococcota bacterium]|nr:hypothetical protein [Myxococcota bacterium]